MLVRNNDRQLLYHQLFSFHPRDHVGEDGKVRDPDEQACQANGRHNVPLDVRCCIGESRVHGRWQERSDEEEGAGQTDLMVSAVRV